MPYEVGSDISTCVYDAIEATEAKEAEEARVRGDWGDQGCTASI